MLLWSKVSGTPRASEAHPLLRVPEMPMQSSSPLPGSAGGKAEAAALARDHWVHLKKKKHFAGVESKVLLFTCNGTLHSERGILPFNINL